MEGNNFIYIPSREMFSNQLDKINDDFAKRYGHPYDLLMGSGSSIRFSPFMDYEREYVSFVIERMGLKQESVNLECINNLLSANRYGQKQALQFALNVHGFRPLFMVDAYLTNYARIYAKRMKQGVKGEMFTIMEEFAIAARSLKGHSLFEESKGSIRCYLLLKLTEFSILTERQKFLNEEEERRHRLREEQKALKELKREKEQAEKDVAKARSAIEKNEAAIAKAKNDLQIKKLQAQIDELKIALQRAEERRERAISMAQQTRCGYVYIISNIGSFGEGVYKIGMTRRIDPMQRVRELGDASVPFPFDVHAMIYTEDAPFLESYLHKVFDLHKVNAVNWRKEYFRVPLESIRKEVENCGIHCEWVEKP